MDALESKPSEVAAVPLPQDVHSPDYIAAYATRILAHIDRFPNLAAPREFLTLEATPRGLLIRALPDVDHSRLVMRLRRRLEHGLGTRAAGIHEDGGEIEVLSNIRLALGASERVTRIAVVDWADHVDARGGKAITADGVLLLVEVTGDDRRDDLDRADPAARPRQYAAAEVPLYLVVDRKKGALLLFSDPVAGTYPEPAVHEVGEKVWLPKPLGFHLETAFMKPLM